MRAARAFVINSGRGGHVVEEDLLAALDSGHIAHAALGKYNEADADEAKACSLDSQYC